MQGYRAVDPEKIIKPALRIYHASGHDLLVFRDELGHGSVAVTQIHLPTDRARVEELIRKSDWTRLRKTLTQSRPGKVPSAPLPVRTFRGRKPKRGVKPIPRFRGSAQSMPGKDFRITTANRLTVPAQALLHRTRPTLRFASQSYTAISENMIFLWLIRICGTPADRTNSQNALADFPLYPRSFRAHLPSLSSGSVGRAEAAASTPIRCSHSLASIS